MTIRESLPLCIDLDGTLTYVDTLHEGLLRALRTNPLRLLGAIGSLRGGKAAFKREVAAIAPIDARSLPYRQDLLDWIRQQKESERVLVLATAADKSTADAVADHLGLFDEVVASEGAANLAGDGKRAALVARFGEKGFDYAGNSSADLKVWGSAANAIVAGSNGLVNKARAIATVDRVFAPPTNNLLAWVKAARLHQWVKNLLVFVALILTHNLDNVELVAASVLAFVAFGLCASSVYIFNDLLDLPSDRRHPRKHRRPFASGRLQTSHGVFVGATLLVASLSIAAAVNLWVLLTILVYYIFTWLYSLRLKRIALVDVMMLAGLYTMRLFAGNAATLVWPSFWVLAFSIFLFLSLGIVKRYAEIDEARREGRDITMGRGYTTADLPFLQTLGTVSGYCAVLVLALYINDASAAALYQHQGVLWLTCPIMLFWISRIWLLTTRGYMHDDPIVFALRDRISLLLAGLLGLGILLAT